MLDGYKREINYLRISVTDRCNLRCTYCMPAEGIQLMRHDEVLSLEKIAEVARIGAEKFGIKKIRLTGGEPLVRKGIVSLVKMLKAIEHIDEISMTTNGILLSKYASELKEAGLSRVNISLDSLNPDKFKDVTRGGNIEDVFKGIETAKEVQLTPVKINVVKMDSSNKDELEKLEEFCQQEELKIQYIKQMNLETGTFSQVEGGQGGNCSICNRLRLSADGYLKPCLFSNQAYSIKELGIEKAFNSALQNKPEKGKTSHKHGFYNIGG
ncbi:GTP 3',8-cyclase MoaA [Labilibacter marinus]|uniref:GTP 3',8-cyclase MoaA n=1 Tax=Labilibacter marinus TaxID=1477105 RepID=UPI00094FE9FF|nr:GTP 3',8-cyclase MoaA [Labilibacter marinus]